MATNLALDDKLIEEVRRIGGYSTKKEAVTVALEEFVSRRKQLAVLDLFGTIDFDEEYSIRQRRNMDKIEAQP